MANRNPVWSLPQVQNGESQHRSLGFGSKSMPSSADNCYPLEFPACYWALVDNISMSEISDDHTARALLKSPIKCKCSITNQAEEDLEEANMLHEHMTWTLLIRIPLLLCLLQIVLCYGPMRHSL